MRSQTARRQRRAARTYHVEMQHFATQDWQRLLSRRIALVGSLCVTGGTRCPGCPRGNNTHISTPAASEPFYLKWIEDRFNGKPLPNGCPNT